MTPQPPAPHVQAAMARAELRALTDKQSIAEYGVRVLSDVAATMGNAIDLSANSNKLDVIMSAVVALVSLRLQELQGAHSANAERIAQLEGFLKQAESRIAIPNLQA